MRLAVAILITSTLCGIFCQHTDTGHQQTELSAVPKPADTMHQQVALPVASQNADAPFAIMDSLKKYERTDSFYIDDEHQFFVGRANNASFGGYVFPDSILQFYQKIQGEWRLTSVLRDGMPYPQFVNTNDLNGDQQKDVIVSYISGAAGNLVPSVFLFGKATGRFNHNPYFDLTNVFYDAKNKWVVSYWVSSSFMGCKEKSRYTVTGDSLKLDLSISYCPNEKNEGETGFLEYSTMSGNKKVVIKTEKGRAENLLHKYEKAFPVH